MNDLAPNNRNLRTLLPIILIVIFSFISYVIFSLEISLKTISVVLAFYTFFGIWVSIAQKNRNISYDNEFMYLKGKEDTEKILLANITRLKLTNSNMKILGFRYSEYRIEYTSNNGVDSRIVFWVGVGSSELDDFESTVKKVNVKLKPEHWSSTFNG